jgi:orotate phosphoribosyltransferase
VGGIVLGTEIGRQLNVRTIFAEREKSKMILRRNFEIFENENVLICEDVVTTGGSVFEVINLVTEYGAKVAGVGFIIDRSNGKVNFGYDQYSLAGIDVIKFIPEDVPEWLKKIPVTKPGSRNFK